MKKVVLLVLIFICILSMTSCIGRNWVLLDTYKEGYSYLYGERDDNINNYSSKLQEVKYANEFLPALDELSGYTNISYSYQLSMDCLFKIPFFCSDAISLFVEYPEDIYEQKKEEVLAFYKFLKEPYIRDDGILESPLAEFQYNGYQFKTAMKEGYTAPKFFMLIGYNDEINRIVYCYYSNIDHDYIAESGEDYLQEMIYFMDTRFYWNDIE